MIYLLKILFLFFFLLPFPLLAVENPTSNSSSISATVPGEPDTPNLISPANNSTISSTAPTFIFNPSLGDTFVTHYQLWIDGNKNTDPISNSTTTITTNALTALTEGQHTWMIKAMGEYNTTRNSATWTFTIDTTAPLILIDQVAEHQTSLSSLDLTTIPADLTFSTNQRQPVIHGQSETNAQLTLILTSSSSTTTITTIAITDNTFSLKPDANLNAGTYSVTISSVDPAGNTTTLPAFNLVITTPAPLFTLPLPSPLPTITIPAISLPFGPIPKLPASLTAYPITTGCPVSIWPWIIILLLIIYILYLRRRLTTITKPL
ncbi:MAG: Ig-like domain-containing protein [Patescibacteria group bacterium]|nr:Ig-like domain-containing protein [Patescibacteria group bacterium]